MNIYIYIHMSKAGVYRWGYFRESSAKVLRRSGRKSKCILKGWPKKPCPKKTLITNGFGDASCMFTSLSRSDPWSFGIIWQVMTDSSLRCCPTWVPRKINMDLADVTCFFAKNGRSRKNAEKGFLINNWYTYVCGYMVWVSYGLWIHVCI